MKASVMFYVDTPTPLDIADLNAERADAAVSIYLPTTPQTVQIGGSRIHYGNLVKQAVDQLQSADFDKRRLALLQEELVMLAEDDDFWRVQANSLAVFATPDRIITFRLANRLTAMTQVSDRFHLNPLLRAVTFPHQTFVLALSENHVRLVEVFSDMPPVEIKVPDLPKDAAISAGKSTLNDRSPVGRIQGSEGQRVRHLQYVRRVDAALRPVLAGRDTPLILAAVDPLASLYRIVNSYACLLPTVIRESADHMTNAQLAEKAIPILDQAYAAEIAAVRALFETRAGQGRTATDLTDAARAATFGTVDTLLVDMDQALPGTIDENGIITLADKECANTYGVVDEIAGRVLVTGGRVLAVRQNDIPGEGSLAAILRYPI
jgi:hypothetical protein